MLIKNKAELIQTAPNSTLTYANIVGIKLIWQNQLAHYFGHAYMVIQIISTNLGSTNLA